MSKHRGRYVSSAFTVVIASVLTAVSGAAEAADPAGGSVDQPAGPVSLLDHLADPTIVHLDVDAIAGVPFAVAVPIGDAVHTLDLLPHSVRGPGYQVLAQVDDGSLVELEPGPIQTYRGSAIETPGSFVIGSLVDGGVEAMIELPEVEGRYWITPLPGGEAGAHLLYHDDQVLSSGGVCGYDETLHDLRGDDVMPLDTQGAGGVAGGGDCFWFAQLACDADFDYFQDWGSSTTNVENVINSIINLANDQYEEQTEISHQIGTILIRTSNAADPYSSTTSPSGLLNEFRNHWNINHGGIARDVAQLFTGRNLADPVIGIAFTQNVCTTSAYSVVQNISVPSCRADLSAHELGHNWSANHCGCGGFTMNSSLTCGIQFHPSFTVPEIVAYRNSRTFCLVNDCVPSNDDCANAMDVTDGTFTFTTNQSSTDGLSEGLCNVNGQSQIDSDIWFRYEAICDGPVAVSICNSNFNTRLAVYQSFCPQVVNQAIACNDDACGSRSELSFDAMAGTDYLLRVGGHDGATGNGQLQILGTICDPPPPNDSCGSAQTLQEGTTAFTTIGATTDGPDEPLECTDGDVTQIEKDVWFRFLAQCDGTATLSVCDADFDSLIAVYGAACPGEAGTALACNDNGCGDQSSISVEVTAGNIYRVRIGGVLGATGIGSLTFTCGDIVDCNANGIPDADEIGDGSTPDCNANGVPDSCDIDDGTSADENGNGVPDECDPPDCPADVDGNGMVDVDDLVAVILAWGTDDPVADLDGSGNVDVDDLVEVILAWGPCDG